MRSSLIGSLVGVLRYNLARKARRVRVFEIGRVFVRDAQRRRDGDAARGRRQRSRCASAAWPTGVPQATQWGSASARVDFFDVKGDVEALLAPRDRALRAGAASGAAPGPLRRASSSTARASASSANCIRSGARPTNCRRRRCCSSSTLDALRTRELPIVRADPAPAVGAARPGAVVVRARQPRRADGARSLRRPDRPGAPRHAVRHLQARQPTADIGAGERSLAVRLELLDDEATLTDERIDAAVGARERGAERARRPAARLTRSDIREP